MIYRGPLKTTYSRDDGEPTVVDVQTGVMQGHGLSSIFYALGLWWITRDPLKQYEGTLVSPKFADDVTVAGPPATVFDGLHTLVGALEQNGMRVQPSKTTLVLGVEVTAEQRDEYAAQLGIDDPAAAVAACKYDAIITGVPVGRDDFMQKQVEENIAHTCRTLRRAGSHRYRHSQGARPPFLPARSHARLAVTTLHTSAASSQAGAHPPSGGAANGGTIHLLHEADWLFAAGVPGRV